VCERDASSIRSEPVGWPAGRGTRRASARKLRVALGQLQSTVTEQRATIEARLLDAVTQAAARDGVAALRVERVLSASEVSRASFYQYFTSVDECFLDAYRLHAAALVGEVSSAVRCAGDPSVAALEALVETAVSRPEAARLLMVEGLAAGPRGLSERQALIAAIGELVEASPGDAKVERPTMPLIGATMRYLAMRLAAGGVERDVAGDVRDWAASFASAEDPWRLRLDGSGNAPGQMSEPPSPATFGAPGEGSPRERVLRAAAACVCSQGYRACQVTDVASAAGVSRRFFYNQFEDKRAAVLAAYEHAFERLLAGCAPAFFAPGAWEDRLWQAWLEFARFFAREPVYAHLGFGQTYALGPAFAPRIEEFHLAFTWFLDGRHHDSPSDAAGPQARSALTAAAVAELAFQSLWQGAAIQMLALSPIVMRVILTPFVGPEHARAFVESKLHDHRERVA